MTKPCPPDLAAFKHEPADYEQPVEAATVGQCDRDAAADYWRECGIGTAETREHYAAGKADDSKLVQAFARHRTQANEAMREALEAAASLLPAKACDRHGITAAISLARGDSA